MVNFVYDTYRDFLKYFPRDFGKVSCHSIDGSDSTDGNGIVVSTTISHNTYGTNASVNSEVLPNVAVKTSFSDFFTKDSI